MTNYLLIESQDRIDARDGGFCCRMAKALAQHGDTVSVLMVGNAIDDIDLMGFVVPPMRFHLGLPRWEHWRMQQDELDVVISLIPDKLGPGFHAVDIMELPIILLVAKRSKIKSANDLWSNKKITEPLISLKPNELICQLFQETLTNRGLSWLPKLEMDSLDLIEKYVEKGFGVGLSIRAPRKRWPSTIRVLELPNFRPVRLGVVYRSESKLEPQVCGAFLEEVRRQAAHFSQKED